MADDITITPGSGATVATDEVASGHFQRGPASSAAGNVRAAALVLEHRGRGAP